jgi:DNA-binding transcriptional regulator YhcF (GntR family)
MPPSFRPTQAQLREVPRERAIESSIRAKILSGSLPAGTALPAMQELARLWSSNYFTVHRALTPLVKEGLLARHKGVGTFVANTRRKLETVGIYYGSDIISDPRSGYAIQLHRLLYQSLKAKGLKIHTWMDPRDNEEAAGSVLPDITRAIETQHIQALITIITQQESTDLLRRLPLPVAHFSSSVKSHNIYFPSRTFLHRYLEHCRDEGRQRVAMIVSPSLLETDHRKHARDTSASFAIFRNLCAREGLETRPQWFHLIDSGSITRKEESRQIHEAYGQLIRSQGKNRPDAVLVFPDNNLVTLHQTLSEQQRSFDSDLKIFSHRNDPLAFPMPEGPHYIALSLPSVAAGLTRLVLDASAGQPCPSIPADLVEGPATPFH